MKVETTCQTVDIQNLTREIQAGTESALHCLEVDLAQVHATACDELFFEFAFAAHIIHPALELIDQRGNLAFGKFRPASIAANASGFDQAQPQTQRQAERRTAPDRSPSLIGFDRLQVLPHVVFMLIRQPVDDQRCVIRSIVQNPRAPCRKFEDRRAPPS